MNGRGFSDHVSRSQLEYIVFDNCLRCSETIIRAKVKNTQRDQIFDPKPVGGTDMDPTYSTHECQLASK